jgi:hypothetical protein
MAGRYIATDCDLFTDATCARCTACVAGEYEVSGCTDGVRDRVCRACESGGWCDGAVRRACPAGSSSATGAKSLIECVCRAENQVLQNGACVNVTCAAGSTRMGNVCVPCPSTSTTLHGGAVGLEGIYCHSKSNSMWTLEEAKCSNVLHVMRS